MIAIIDYKAGNLTSVKLAVKKVGAEAVITSDPIVIKSAERIIFPGVGAAGAAMDNLRALGLDSLVKEEIASGKPFLGICVGLQVLFEMSEEDGDTECLGIVPGQVKLFKAAPPETKVPQMGWNSVNFIGEHPLIEGVRNNSYFYFVHSYYPAPSDSSYTLGETTYADVTFSSMIFKDNLVASQFHLEKSGKVGLKILENFCKWDGKC
ncbi:MAG: imidazole glycerol phosphate synthase subunit HisH [Kiritimatiellae bacterium]|jgi:glutamine amidotransferase|nr:imidazole glycerol phosphate synthase subunit HisH [Kiritimatiellia bacterium]